MHVDSKIAHGHAESGENATSEVDCCLVVAQHVALLGSSKMDGHQTRIVSSVSNDPKNTAIRNQVHLALSCGLKRAAKAQLSQ